MVRKKESLTFSLKLSTINAASDVSEKMKIDLNKYVDDKLLELIESYRAVNPESLSRMLNVKLKARAENEAKIADAKIQISSAEAENRMLDEHIQKLNAAIEKIGAGTK